MKYIAVISLIVLLSISVVHAQPDRSAVVENLREYKKYRDFDSFSSHPFSKCYLPHYSNNTYAHQQFYKDKVKELNAIIPDFQVNENVGPNGAHQESASISTDDSGNFVIAWVDERNGDSDIYAQRYSSNGSPLGTNFKVNDDQGSALQGYPSISTDDSGNFVITWVDDRDGDWDIYAQRYASNGSTLGTNFKVNDNNQGSVDQWYHSISMDNIGNFVITWMDYRNGVGDIYAQRYSSDGSTLGNNFKVNDEPGDSGQGSPSISADSSGNFVITWDDDRNGDLDIYAQRYASNGSPLGANFKVNDDVGSESHWWPSISTDDSGNFVITWMDTRNGDWDIYAQRHSSDGSPLGTNFRVNDDVGSESQASPSISTDCSGNFVITWADWRNGDTDTYAQRYSSDCSPLGTNFRVNDDVGSTDQWWPSISTTDSGNFVITWMDYRNGNWDIYVQRYAIDGSTLGTNFKINDDQGSSDQYAPSISADDSGNFVIMWEDKRNGDSDIYAQRYSSDGSVLGTNFKVNDDVGSADQVYPSMSTNDSGNFMITWADDRNVNWDIYGQLYSSDGSPLGTNFKVNDQGCVDAWYHFSSTYDGGNFVISWADDRNGDWDIYAQRYTNDGSPLGTNFKVNDQGSVYAWYFSSSTDNSSNFVITWADVRSGDFDIYAQRYANDGSPLGSNFIVNDNTGSSHQTSPSISADSSGNFVITWDDDRNGDLDIYAQRYASNGSPLGANFKVNEQGSVAPWYHFISTDGGGNFIIIWTDNRNGDPDIYAQRYASDGHALGTNFRVTNTSEKYQNRPDVKLWNGRIYTTWTDSRAGSTGYDIWANVLDWNNPIGITERELSQIPSSFILGQNYPNPFNPITTIEFSIPHTEFVTLKIYNILGEEVATLVSERLNAGQYRHDWDASGFSSGVYLYRLQAGNYVNIKKMVLLQ